MIKVETSARHVHLKESDFKILFGDEKLTVKKELSQPGQFCANEKVSIVGVKNTISNVSILGPFRSETQVEVSKTDCRTLGVDAPIRESGDLEGSGAITILGSKGELTLEKGLIVAKRHIHMNLDDAKEFNVTDKEVVKVRIPSKRPLVFEDVVVRVSKDYALAMHIDTDEANAAGIEFLDEVLGSIEK